ncbi:MAG TPA: hypothetical protein VE174_13370 [Actinomycetota bacterium]|nr:hypothetical protein [Actinomycetota bacterium]
MTVGSETQQLTAAAGGGELHFELDADDKLDKGKVTALSVSIVWTGGVTYSSIDFDTGAPVTIDGYK